MAKQLQICHNISKFAEKNFLISSYEAKKFYQLKTQSNDHWQVHTILPKGMANLMYSKAFRYTILSYIKLLDTQFLVMSQNLSIEPYVYIRFFTYFKQLNLHSFWDTPIPKTDVS